MPRAWEAKIFSVWFLLELRGQIQKSHSTQFYQVCACMYCEVCGEPTPCIECDNGNVSLNEIASLPTTATHHTSGPSQSTLDEMRQRVMMLQSAINPNSDDFSWLERILESMQGQDQQQLSPEIRSLIISMFSASPNHPPINQDPTLTLNDAQLLQFINSTADMDTTPSSSNHATSKEILNRIPRIIIDHRSSILLDCQVNSEPAIAAEFGPHPTSLAAPIALPPTEVVLASPIHGHKSPLTPLHNLSELKNKIAYFDRGGGVNFATKALQAQHAGATGVIIGNNNLIWP